MLDLLYATLPLLVAAGTLLVFRRERALVAGRLRRVAPLVDGWMEEGRWPYHARLCFSLDEARAEIGCLYGGTRGGSTPRTFVWMRGLEGLGDVELEVRRRPSSDETGRDAFERAFHGSGETHLLDAAARDALLAVDPRASVVLRLGRAPAYRHGCRRFGAEETRLEVTVGGVPPRPRDLEALVEVTRAAHACLTADERRQAA